MKALRLHSSGKIQIHDEPIPEPGEGEALVRVTSVAICGSDIHWVNEGGIGDAKITRPLILGHEAAGIIASGPRTGTRVAIDPAINCGECKQCQEGNPNLCQAMRFSGHGLQDGALREYMPWPEKFLFPIPETLSLDDAAMLEPLGVAIYAMDIANIKPGMRIGVLGCGPIGLLLIQLAKQMGATQIIATEKLPHRLEAARACGATDAFLIKNDEDFPDFTSITESEGVDIAFEAAGSDHALQCAVEAAGFGTSVILVGIPDNDEHRLTASLVRRKGLTIKLCRRMKHTYPRAIRLAERGLVDLRSIVTHHFPIDQFQEAFSAASSRQGLKVIIEPTPPINNQ